MTWQVPITWTNSTLTNAQLNAQLRDNMLEMPIASATLSGQYWVATGTTAGALRRVTEDSIAGSNTTTSNTYTDLTAIGPTCSLVSTGIRALVSLYAHMSNSVAGNQSFMSYEVSGATSIAAADSRSVSFTNSSAADVGRLGATFSVSSLTAGANTFQAKYRCNLNTTTFLNRLLIVTPY